MSSYRQIFDPSRPALVAFAILCAFAARPASAGDEALAVAATPVPARLDFDDLKETRLFPLFSPSRRPPPPIAEAPVEVVPVVPVAETAPLPPTPPSLELVGIVEADGGAVVLLKDPSGRTNCVRAGEMIDDWQLRVIGPRMVALAHPDVAEQQILRVTFPGSAARGD